jgi:hypothetical protein
VNDELDLLAEQHIELVSKQEDLNALEFRKSIKLQELRHAVKDQEEILVKLTQASESLEQRKEDRRIIETTKDPLQKRIEAAEKVVSERRENDPELIFLRDRVQEKQVKADIKEQRIHERKTSDTLEAFRRRVLELEAKAAALGAKLAEASEALSREQELLDHEVGKLPIDRKIEILARL